MPKNRLLFIIVFFVLTALLFELSFLFDFNTDRVEISHDSHRQSLWIFFVAIGLAYIPCFILGYGGFNPLLGFFPPILLTSVFWLLVIIRFNKAGIDLLNTDRIFPYTALGVVILSGFFGVLVTSLTSRAVGDRNNPSVPVSEEESSEGKTDPEDE